jgi:asparagine synthase (glutamine-hydrolysing)
MFAFAAFHPGRGELWLVRDRFGVKPLAWGRLPDGGMSFSSSVAGVAHQAGAEVDAGYCARGLRYKVFETARSGSPFRNVHTVPAGSWTRFRLSDSGLDVAESRWYDLGSAVAACSESIMRSSDGELIEQCHALLHSAVHLRLRSDVPVAVSLSGGLDSSTVAALAAREVEELRGFTYGAPHAALSEGPTVRAMSEEIGVGVTYVWPRYGEAALGDALDRTMAFQEAPFSGLSLLAQNEVFRSVREARFKVLLGGQGGDESFAGYRKFFIVALREAMRRREPWNTMKAMHSLALMLIHEAGQARRYWSNINRYRNRTQDGFRLLNWTSKSENLWGGSERTLSGRQIDDVLQWSLPTLLRYEDRNSMGYGVESRLPFMDYRLLELAVALPARLKIRNGYGKWVLRKMTAGVVPDIVRLNRKKRGFDVTQAWVREGIGAHLCRTIGDNRSAVSDHLQRGIDLNRMLSDEALSNDSNLLDEALMLAWLTKPVRRPVQARAMAEAA